MSLTAKQWNQMQTLFAKCDDDDLDKMVDMFKAQRSVIAQTNRSKFVVGQKVHAKRPNGTIVFKNGVIVKINRKNIIVQGSQGQWNCSPNLLIAA